MSGDHGEVCRNCKWHDSDGEVFEDGWGLCRFDSPGNNELGLAVWPSTGPEDWCRHFYAKVVKLTTDYPPAKAGA